jgi:hypothetical protein
MNTILRNTRLHCSGLAESLLVALVTCCSPNEADLFVEDATLPQDGLAMEFVEDREELRVRTEALNENLLRCGETFDGSLTLEQAESLQSYGHFDADDDDQTVNTFESVNGDDERVPNIIINNMEMDNTPTKEKRHRRMPRGRKHTINYVAIVVCEIKNKIGMPEDNAANRMVAMRIGRTIMESHGMRPTHINQVLSTVVELVFIPNDAEIFSAMVRKSQAARMKKRAYNGRWSWWGGWIPTRSSSSN